MPVARCILLALLLTLSAATVASSQPRSGTAAARPVILSVSPTTVEPSDRIAVRGRRFVKGRKNVVEFLGAGGSKDNVKVRATGRSNRLLVLKAPRARVAIGGKGAVSGRIRVINRFGKSRSSARSLRFDNDGDGLSNETELKRGTNPLKRDTDGDGRPDGSDPDPLTAPGSGSGSGPGASGATSCAAPGAQLAGTSATTTFAGLEILAASRALLSHTAFAGDGFKSFCLRRKLQGQPDSAYQVVGSSDSPAGGTIIDTAPASKGADYLYRTDAVTAAGHVPGANAVALRGSTVIAGLPGWAVMDQTCNGCGFGAIVPNSAGTPAALALGAFGDGSPSGTFGERAMFGSRVRLIAGGEIVARVATPGRPSLGAYVAGTLSLSDQHPVTIRSDAAGTAADVSDSILPWISVELRHEASGEIHAVVLDSEGPGASKIVGDSGSLPAAPPEIPAVTIVYLTIKPLAGGRYGVQYKTNAAPDGSPDTPIDLNGGAEGASRELPGALPNAWLSLATETTRAETATREARFDEVWDRVTPDGAPDSAYDLNETFGGPLFPAPPAPPPPAP